MMSLVAVIAVSLVGVVGLRLLARLTAVAADPFITEPWLSGHRPSEHAMSRYHVRWYTASIVFLAFDVEMLFMYPWAVVVSGLGPGAIVEMFGFLLMLLLAVMWARREGAFRWV
jgi:NADH-quinone oxidoreductase subunit A